MESFCDEPEICRDFLRNACMRGSRCRFRHESTSGACRSASGGRHDGCRCRFELDSGGIAATAPDMVDDAVVDDDDDDNVIHTSDKST